MTFDSLINAGEYFPPFYLDEILPGQLTSGVLKEWSAKERRGEYTPRQGLRDLARDYLAARAELAPYAEKFSAVRDARAVAGQLAAQEALKGTATDRESAAFQPSPSEGATADGVPESDGTPEGEWRAALATWHTRLLKALGFTPRPGHLTAHTPTGQVAVPVAHSEAGIAVLAGGFTVDADAARGDGQANRLAVPVRVAPGKTLTTVTDLAAWLLATRHGPRYVLLLFGGVMVLGDRESFGRGRHLAVVLDTALPRKAAKSKSAGELDLIAAVFGASALRRHEDGTEDDVSRLVAASRDHGVGVTAELRHGLQKSVQLIANEVLSLARAHEWHVQPEDLQDWLPDVLKNPDDLPRQLTGEALRYLYRILFLLYAEARPELDILPMRSKEYVSGYSVARLRDLVVREKLGTSSRDGHHFHESLALLFEKVFTGHPTAVTRTTREQPLAAAQSEPATDGALAKDDGHAGVRIEALRSELFDPERIHLVGQIVPYPAERLAPGQQAPKALDLRLRNEVLHQVLRHLTIMEGKGKRARGGFISYANLSINQLGAVYEGLMSYTGYIAKTPLYEVAKGGDPHGGSWLVTADQADSGRYPDTPGNSVFVKETADTETRERKSVVHPVGTYVYRLAGRERQTSASYYTPQSLTEVTVEQTLRFRLAEDGSVDPLEPEKADVTAAEVLRWRVCEPALGSGAFLNEAVNQLAALYLRLAERDRGEQIDPESYQRELQKAKAYIALHNAYGVDLNDTAVELAEVSLWLNTMYRGMKAPWYGLHLRRGNSLIGASRKVYPGQPLEKGAWLKGKKDRPRPRAVPLGQKLEGSGVHQPVHQFLLPARGWGSIADEVSLRKPKRGDADARPKSVVAKANADWLDPELIEQMTKWRAALRRSPKGAPKRDAKKDTKPKAQPAEASPEAEEAGQGALDLGLDFWEQGTLLSEPVSTGGGGRGLAAVKRAEKSEANAEDAESRYQTGRLRELARRVEYLWELVVLRLQLSEQEISRTIDVWGAGDAEGSSNGTGGGGPVMDRDAVRQAFHAEGSPYWRLRQLMDAWCALWFWPLEEVGLLNGTAADYFADGQDLKQLKRGQASGIVGADRKVALNSLDDWLEFAEALVGRVDADEAGKGKVSLFEVPRIQNLRDLDAFERELDEVMVDTTAWMDTETLGDTFPWWGLSYDIARERGFLHWELDFAHIFAEGGFDLMVGNPPWVRQEWDENAVLAELEPWFVLGGRDAEANRKENVESLLVNPGNRSFYLKELETVAGVSEFLSSPETYPELAGTRPDMYRAFMLLTWRAIGKRGAAGLIHPSTHLTGGKEGALRRAAYRHLRLHADFVNELYLFAKPVDHSTHFSVNVYGPSGDILFDHLSWLVHPDVLRLSIRHNGMGPDINPGIKYGGTWDLRPHKKRVVKVDRSTLVGWQKLLAESNSPPVEETRLLFPVARAEGAAIGALANWSHRLASLDPRISAGFNEKSDRTAGYFVWDSGSVESWSEVILQGRFFGIATPFAKRPVEGATDPLQVEPWDATAIEASQVPRTNYRRPEGCSRASYRGVLGRKSWLDHELLKELRGDSRVVNALATLDEQERENVLFSWSRRPYTDFYRVVWRRQIQAKNGRCLLAALMPPGPAHVHTLYSMSLPSSADTVLTAGFWASLPLEYFLRATGRIDLQVGEAHAMPAPSAGHPLAAALSLRTLRLNCQTEAYDRIWRAVFNQSWTGDVWAARRWPRVLAPLADGLNTSWTSCTPLRSDLSRRAALVEIDALVAVWLGISSNELVAMYRARFPVLQQYEENMWFDADGRRIAKAHQQHGYGQPKDAWKQLSSPERFPDEVVVPDGYRGPLYRANRIKEMTEAHAEFTRRMRAVGWEPGNTTGPPLPDEE